MARPSSNTGASAAVLVHPDNANAPRPIDQTLHCRGGGFQWHQTKRGREPSHCYYTPNPF